MSFQNSFKFLLNKLTDVASTRDDGSEFQASVTFGKRNVSRCSIYCTV